VLEMVVFPTASNSNTEAQPQTDPVIEKPSRRSSPRSQILEQHSSSKAVNTLEPLTNSVGVMEQQVALHAASHSNNDALLCTDIAVNKQMETPPACSGLIQTQSFYGKSKRRLPAIIRSNADSPTVQCPPRNKCKPARYND
jgi:hypothetical protein